MKVDVIGAGLAGLLAAGMLRQQCHAVYERAATIPNNHSAVLRFRSSVVADTLNIPFKRVMTIKSVHQWVNPIADAMSYSLKTNGTATMRSVLTADGIPQERFIAPPDLVSRMFDLVSCPFEFGMYYAFQKRDRPIISTIPMPKLMDDLEYKGPRPEFKFLDGTNVVIELENVEAYCSLYIPDPNCPAARISITGNQMIAECYGENPNDWSLDSDFNIRSFLSLMGIPSMEFVKSVEVKPQSYGKILPIDEGERRRFIMWASEECNVYSLGRFATWRPGLLLDDVVNDVRVIQRLISNRGESYPHKMKG